MRRYSLLTQVFLLIATLVLFEVSGWDMQLQHWFYLGDGHWLLAKDQPILRWVFYDGPKVVLILLFLLLLILLPVSYRRRTLAVYRPGLFIVLLALGLVPATVSLLKSSTNVACPVNLQAFGGEVIYAGNLRRYLSQQRPESLQKCFPAGHASGGFALMSLFFLFRHPHNRRRALMAGATLGWVMGLYKMAIGDHFISHTLVSMQLAWLLISVLAWAQYALGQYRARGELQGVSGSLESS